MEYLRYTPLTNFFVHILNLTIACRNFKRMSRKLQLNFFRITFSTPKKTKIIEEQKFEYDVKDYYPSMDLSKHFPSLFTDSHLNFKAEFQYSTGNDFYLAEV